ncbi:hypothetical protein ZIOFF_031280 [Zingiber officinale]|uniref:Uncharacterized protein n=1 Tax=Zingiber officinale TaxID=94328 RepID=A0A8J5GEH9_ZINOF|nr:hypothetical protein ZIOFF_031280 [Zingiber officinale]
MNHVLFTASSRKLGVQHTRPSISCGEFNDRSCYDDTQSHGYKTRTVESKFVKTRDNYPVEILEALRSGECQPKPNEGTNGSWSAVSFPISGTHQSALKQLDEMQVIESFIHAAKRLKSEDSPLLEIE